jgi:hypothetical protein
MKRTSSRDRRSAEHAKKLGVKVEARYVAALGRLAARAGEERRRAAIDSMLAGAV